uniref:RNA helicase n=1 Tax=Pseudo-nitzschia australis TaxID=44445 RepID=A0A7S4AEU3_9STRA|mmetsp:Transcript_21212/g.45011  ORF Transcript_21212/g.45011 Transcript_21212/m.45011 type:complete len:613 (-) Transcript_21212:4-1842(-)
MSSLFGKKNKLHNTGSKERNAKLLLKRKQEEVSAAAAASKEEIDGGEREPGSTSNNSTRLHLEDVPQLSPWADFGDLGLTDPLVETCKALGFKRPTPVQRHIVPFLLRNESAHVLALASTGSGKTAAFVLPILHRLSADPYGIYAVIVSPTRELAKQIHQQVLALGSSYNVESTLVVGGMDMTKQSSALEHRKPHFVVATPGRLAELLRGPSPPNLQHVRFLVLDEADRLLTANSGFEKDVAELLLHCNRNKRTQCQTLLFSATMTRSLESVEEIAGAGKGRLPLKKFVIRADEGNKNKRQKLATTKNESGGESDDENDEKDEAECGNDENDNDTEDKIRTEAALTPRIPAGLKQEYIFMPSRVRDAYLLTIIRNLLSNGGRAKDSKGRHAWRGGKKVSLGRGDNSDSDDDDDQGKSRSTIVFVATCERAALVSGILNEVGVENVALHSLLTQNRRLAALGKFKSQQVRVLVATDIASRGLDVPSVDLVINSELPRNPVSYVHRIGRTARAGRRGRAISLVSEQDVSLVHAAEEITGRPLEKCSEITDEDAIRMLGPVTKAARLAKMKLMDIGFDELVKKFKERKARDRKERQRIERSLRKQAKKAGTKNQK